MNLNLFILILMISSLVGCGTTLSYSGQTVQDIDLSGGWLPKFIPASAIDIHTTNDLDTNRSWGHFTLPADEVEHFFAHCEPDGTAYRYNNTMSTWIFEHHTDTGLITYTMMPSQSDRKDRFDR